MGLWPGRDGKWHLKAMALSLPVLLIVAVLLSSYLVVQVINLRAATDLSVILRPPALPCPASAGIARRNPIQAENRCPGTDQWREDHPLGTTHAIEAFADPASVNWGDTLSLYVSTTAPTYRLSIYRIGWYQGYGARLMYTSPVLQGIAQPAPRFDAATRMVTADTWHPPIQIAIPRQWTSGTYIVKLVSSQGYMRYTPFVVRDDSSHAQMLVQVSVLTYQAYNLWGSYSLYRGLKVGVTAPPANPAYLDPNTYVSERHAYAVSLDRPLWDYDGDAGLGDFARYEINLVHWLERMGYDATYSADTDTDARGSLLLHHHLFIVAGHDEYWSTGMRQAAEAARNAGVSLAFMGANDIYWHVRLQAGPLGSDRVEVCYKPGTYPGTADDPERKNHPGETTTEWRLPPLNQPEDAVMGEMYHGSAAGSFPLVLAQGAAPLLAGTHLAPGDAIPGLINSEYDAVYADTQSPPLGRGAGRVASAVRADLTLPPQPARRRQRDALHRPQRREGLRCWHLPVAVGAGR